MLVLFSLLFVTLDVASSSYQSKIINGDIAFIEDFPYMVSVQFLGSHMCGGAILDENTILTAAHCMKLVRHMPLISWMLRVQAGTSKLYNGGQYVSVWRIFSHPGYESKVSDNDIAVLKLWKPLKFGEKVQPVNLPTGDLQPGTLGLASGWGRIAQGGPMADRLYSVGLPVLPQEDCIASYPEEIITERMFCAGYPEGGRDACQGDSGGPLVFNNTVIGIVSWGYGCAQKGRPGVFTNVYKLIDYVQENRQK